MFPVNHPRTSMAVLRSRPTSMQEFDFHHPSREAVPLWLPGSGSCSNYSCPLLLPSLTLKIPLVYPSLSSAAFLCHWQPSYCPSYPEFREFPVTSVTAAFGSPLPLFNSFCQLSYHCWLQKFICCRQQRVHIWSAWRCCPGCCPCLLLVYVSSCSVAS